MVESILSYGLLVWAGPQMGNATFIKICYLQDKIIFNLLANVNDDFENVNLIYKRHRILKLPDLYKLRAALFLYKVFNQNYAPFILERLQPVLTQNAYILRNNNLFVAPFPRVNTIKFNFIFNAVKVWNSLRDDIRQSRSLNILKSLLKRELK